MTSSIEEIGFFNPVYPQDGSHRNEKMAWLGRSVEWYFDIGQTSYSILPGPVADKSVPLIKNEAKQRSFFSMLMRVAAVALKIISYLTLVLPLIMVVGKLVYRAENRFSLQKQMSEKEIHDYMDLAEKTIRDQVSSQFVDDLAFDRAGDLTRAVTFFETINKKKEQFHRILQNSSSFLDGEQYGKFLEAINTLDLQIGKLAAKIKDYKEIIIQEIKRIQEEIQNDLDGLNPNELHRAGAGAWKNLQKIHKFIYQFRDRLGVESTDRDNQWVAEDGTELYDQALVARLSNMIVPKGIVNLGATCFMNASIQALIANPDFRERIKNVQQPIYGMIQEKMALHLAGLEMFDDAEEAAQLLFDSWNTLTIKQLTRHANIMNNAQIREELSRVIEEMAASENEDAEGSGEDLPLDEGTVREAETIVAEGEGVDSEGARAEEREREPTRAERLLAMLGRELPEELPHLVGDIDNPDWLRAEFLINAIKGDLLDFARTKSVMSILRSFVNKYEERGTKPADLRTLATNLRAAFWYAGRMERSVYDQQDAAPIIDFILDAIGYAVPLEMIRQGQKTGEAEQPIMISQRAAQPAQLLQIPISGGEGVSLQKLLDSYTAESEQGDDDNRWRATDPRTNSEVTFEKWTEKQRVNGEPPEFLQVQLKRFEWNMDGTRRKIDQSIDVGNFEMDLSRLFEAEGLKVKYRIVSGVIHHGSLDSGHYYMVGEKAGEWFRCNDSNIYPEADPGKELSNAYVLFLQKIVGPEAHAAIAF